MNLHDFFRTIITTPEGHFCLAFRGTNGWTEEWYRWPDDLDRIVARAEALRDTNDVYFSSYLFKTTSSTKDNVLPSRTFQADLDNADVSSIPVLPTVLVRTSPNRHQAYWVLEELAGVDGIEGWIDAHEMISRRLTYAIPLCDRSGWPAGRKVRVPDTLNHKYLDGAKPVEIVGESMRKYVAAQFELLPDVPRAASEPYESGFLDAPASGAAEPALGPNELLLRFKDKIGKSYIQYNIRQPDRSVALWALVCALFRAGASRDEVFWIARKSANNKFSDLHHNADRELAKDVLRAEQVVRSETLDPRAIIAQARRNSGPVNERRQIMLDTVLVSMRDQGDFVHTYGGSVFYVRRDSGRPIAISKRSEYFDMLLDLQYGLNSVEIDSRFVAAGVYTYANSIPQNGRLGALAHYDDRGHFMLLHTGRKEVLQISKDGISKITDGSYGIVFPWDPGIEPFAPTPPPADFDWADFLFSHPLGPTSGAADALGNVVSCSRDEALALLKVWMLFLLFRELSAARPILAMIGQPGCISGATKLEVKRGSHSPATRTVAQMFRNMASRWDETIPTRLHSEKDGVVAYRTVKRVIYSGVKDTYTVAIEGRPSFRTTADHRFLTPTGYKQLSELAVGDAVVTKGRVLDSDGPLSRLIGRAEVTAHYHPHARQRMVNGCGPYGTIMRARVTLEAAMNGLPTWEFLDALCSDPVRSATFTYLPKDAHIHHKDHNPLNDVPENLVALTKMEHDTLHGHHNAKNLGKFSGMFSTSTAKITSIEPYGAEATYDIEMEDEDAPNFLLNDVVVHNSGKTVLFKKLYALLYGRNRGIASITNPDDFDHGVANDPFYALDNVDTWERWLPDRLALSAAVSDIRKRKLYTDVDIVTVRRQAMVGISAHNPKFGREDVADRMLIFTFKRLENFIAEEEIIGAVHARRNDIWGGIIRDIQAVLRTPPVRSDEAPQFRIEDFAKVGLWIARALNCEEQFCAGLERVKAGQRNFTLEEESLLTTAIRRLVDKDTAKLVAIAEHGPNGTVAPEEWRSPGQLWGLLELESDDVISFVKAYKNSVNLHKKLWSMQESLKGEFDISWQQDARRAGKLWRIRRRENAQ